MYKIDLFISLCVFSRSHTVMHSSPYTVTSSGVVLVPLKSQVTVQPGGNFRHRNAQDISHGYSRLSWISMIAEDVSFKMEEACWRIQSSLSGLSGRFKLCLLFSTKIFHFILLIYFRLDKEKISFECDAIGQFLLKMLFKYIVLICLLFCRNHELNIVIMCHANAWTLQFNGLF